MNEIVTNQRVWVMITNGVSRNTRYLLGTRGKSCNHPNQLGFFGGSIDPNETPVEAALRELSEETRLVVKKVQLVHDLTCQHKERELIYFQLLWNNRMLPSITREVQDYNWFSLDEIHEMPKKNVHYAVRAYIECSRRTLL